MMEIPGFRFVPIDQYMREQRAELLQRIGEMPETEKAAKYQELCERIRNGQEAPVFTNYDVMFLRGLRIKP